MLGLDDYGSDSDSSRPGSPRADTTSHKSVPKPRRAPKKITIALPTIFSKDDNEEEDFERPAKKHKTAGVSSLLSILPTPKQSIPVPVPQRVLRRGLGRGLHLHSQSSAESTTLAETTAHGDETESTSTVSKADDLSKNPSTTLFRPTSLAKGRKNISVEEHSINQPRTENPLLQKPSTSSGPAVDFFSIGATIRQTSVKASALSSTSLPISSAPAIPTFEPPEPTPTDTYPGYYQLPSGAWAAYDPEYYAKFAKKWQEEYNAQVRALEKGAVKGFEGLEDSAVGEVDAMKEMERAKKEIQEREERKAITMGAGGAPAAPRMNITASKLSGIARSRHQLSTLLKEAYENREALEEKIAQGKRNRKEAGNKYGF